MTDTLASIRAEVDARLAVLVSGETLPPEWCQEIQARLDAIGDPYGLVSRRWVLGLADGATAARQLDAAGPIHAPRRAREPGDTRPRH